MRWLRIRQLEDDVVIWDWDRGFLRWWLWVNAVLLLLDVGMVAISTDGTVADVALGAATLFFINVYFAGQFTIAMWTMPPVGLPSGGNPIDRRVLPYEQRSRYVLLPTIPWPVGVALLLGGLWLYHQAFFATVPAMIDHLLPESVHAWLCDSAQLYTAECVN
jgi:hypothetical protein